MGKKERQMRGQQKEEIQKTGGATHSTGPSEETKRNILIMNKQADEKKKKISDLLLRTNGEFPREERDFIEYYFFEDLSEEEAAKKLNVSPEKFWRIFDSAVTKIRRAIPNIGNF